MIEYFLTRASAYIRAHARTHACTHTHVCTQKHVFANLLYFSNIELFLFLRFLYLANAVGVAVGKFWKMFFIFIFIFIIIIIVVVVVAKNLLLIIPKRSDYDSPAGDARVVSRWTSPI